MNKGKYLDSVEKACFFLKRLSLVKEKNVVKIMRCESEKYSKTFKKLSQKGCYVDIYKSGIAYNEYDLLLVDSSFLQFSFDTKDGIIRYAYYPNPNQFKSYEEFLNAEFDSSEEEVGDTYRDLYDQFIEEQTELRHVTQFRYDYDEKLYDELIHATAHVHYGGEEIRVPCDKILTPLSFVMMVVHHYYGSKWKDIVRDDDLCRGALLAKGQCEGVGKAYFSENERRYFFVG